MASALSKDSFLRIYRHLLRLCRSFPNDSTSLKIRDVLDTASNVMTPYNASERGTRAVRTCLAKHELNMRSQEIEISDKGHSGTIEIVQQAMEDKLPPPELPGSMQLTRSDMLLYLRKNFDLGKECVAKAPAQEQVELAHQSATRAIIMGDFLHWQMLLHQMSSVRTTSFQGLLPPEEVLPFAGQSSTTAQAAVEVDRSAQSPQQDAGSPEDTQSGGKDSLEQLARPDGMQQDTDSATASQSDEEQAKEQAQRALRRTRELRDVQIELDRVNRLYKRKSPLVRDANEFEALCMSSSRGSSSGQGRGDSVDSTEPDAGPQYCGLVQRQAKLRIQAVPFPTDPENNDTGLNLSGDRLLFYYQILVENIGDSAVQLLGRYHEISCPWDVIKLGSREEPRGHRTDGVVLLPGSSVMEQQYAVFEGSEGTMKGGFLCRMLPIEIARELDRLASCNEVKKSERLKMKALDPDCHFIADIGKMRIRKLDRPFSEKMYESIDAGYESDDERDERLEVDSDSEDDPDSDTEEVRTRK